MKKHLWTWEKHNVLHYINRSNLTQFTCHQLVQKIEPHSGYYTEGVISQFLFELSQDGYLVVTYVSMGNKTVAVYTKKTQ